MPRGMILKRDVVEVFKEIYETAGIRNLITLD
jgi:hypothetical protein